MPFRELLCFHWNQYWSIFTAYIFDMLKITVLQILEVNFIMLIVVNI